MRELRLFFVKLLEDDQGQDLVEYTLLVAFVCLAASAIFITAGLTIEGIWTTANSTLTNANVDAGCS